LKKRKASGAEQPVAAEPVTRGDGSGHGVYLELLGAGGLYSVNYEYRLPTALALRLGFSWWEFCFLDCSEVITVPVSLTGFVGGRNSHLEFGAGVTWVATNESRVFLVPQLGYRYMQPTGGFLFRLMFTPLIDVSADVGIQPFFGISLGTAWR